MANLNNPQIEALAVTAITTASFLQPLTPNIPIGDKGISFDGHIDVMKNTSEERAAFLGKVPVQVKGKEVEEFSKGVRNYSLNMDHYINFYKNNGAILFVVEVKSTGENKIFYKQLLPYELKLIITNYGHQKSRTIELRELEGTSLYEVCKRFLTEGEKQSKYLIENNPFKQEDFTSFSVTSLTFNPEKDTNIEEHYFTFYGIVNNLHVPIGIGKLKEEASEFEETIIINGTECINVNVKLINNKLEEKITLIFNKSLTITIHDKNNFSFIINNFLSVDTQLKVLPILIAFITGDNIEFKKAGHTFVGGQIHDPNMLPKIEELYQNFINLEEAFSLMNVDSQIRFIEEPPNLVNTIKLFVDIVLNNDLSKINIDSFNKDQILFNFDLGGLKFLLLLQEKPTLHFLNAFSERVLLMDPTLIVNNPDGEITKKCPTSPYIKLEYQDLINFTNIDFNVLKRSFEIINPIMETETFPFLNNFCLNCINAYDETKQIEFLNIADFILTQHKGGLSESDEVVIKINSLQIKIRIFGNLTHEDNLELIHLKQESINNNLLFCTSILLGSKVEAEIYYNKFTKEEKEELLKFPIYNLFKKMLAE
ncbi:hypothetical protein [Lysinibacillus sphaericus]|uniref:hypothetical protein n=1 Tax=Lysinibacillus sphaericus TaxID=1421 RepID=UPI000C196473|nr:hypothetical protein [Lysinibacillus sphaericus]PIJ98077.1 hypothetical protein CTN02_10065 [Lysinibacillus sphaericus]